LELERTFKKSEKAKRALFEITSGEGELKSEENYPQRLQKYTEAVLLYFHQF
jgi:hypothetical protein